ncbi:MAG: HAD family hydrolase [Spirochaetales bacterium]|nr:HAD family hydrolase [Candidatus Physcosoma equi]
MKPINFLFDIDGTLIPFGNEMPQSAVKAIRKAKEQGHRLFFCTGRSEIELMWPLGDLPFEGGVFSGGNIVTYGGKKVYKRVFSPGDRDFIYRFCEEKELLPLYQAEDGTYATQETMDFAYDLLFPVIGTGMRVPGLKLVDRMPKDLEIIKFMYFAKNRDAMECRRLLEPRFGTVDNTVGTTQDWASEVNLPGANKAAGIVHLLSALGEKDASSCCGIGDGANDIEMMEYCGLGIAMGNASDEVKSHADFVTGRADEDGIAEALAYACRYFEEN